MRRPEGFSLLEVLMAFAIMAVSITIMLRIFGSGVSNAALAEDYSIGVQMAESLMARTGVETVLQTGELEGREGGRYVWRVVVVELPKPQTSENSQPPPSLFLVKVVVAWNDGGHIELSGLKSL